MLTIDDRFMKIEIFKIFKETLIKDNNFKLLAINGYSWAIYYGTDYIAKIDISDAIYVTMDSIYERGNRYTTTSLDELDYESICLIVNDIQCYTQKLMTLIYSN